jgi:hypothetical protein
MNKEHVNLTANQRLMELLASINHQIAYKLIECVKYRWKSPISYLDFGDTNDTISFVTSSKVWELMDKCGEDYKNQVWISNRSTIKIGKAIKMIFGDSFPINHPKNMPEVKPKIDIESFVNMFKAERDKNKNYERFELVKGRDIKYWYNQKNYSRFITEDTTLAKSCLRYEEAGKFLDMYVHNTDYVNMLILKDDADRLRARAIVWHLSYPENRIYMDRVYTINDFDVELYKNYAREQGWFYKTRQTYGYQHNIIDGRTGEELNWENFPMRVVLKNKPIKYYPYLDTLSVYNPETGIISNEGKLLRKPPYLKLADPQGGYIDEADHRDMVFSRLYNEEIAREEAEFIDLDQDWIFQQDVVYVHNSGGKKSYRNSPLVVESNIFGKRKYFLKNTCVWSNHLNTYIYKESSREAYLDTEKTQKVIIHRRMIGKYFELKSNGDIIKKMSDSTNFGRFEDYLKSKGLTMKSKHSTIEKLYKEWQYNRTIHWDEPIDETDTEEITSERTIRFSNATSPWYNPYSDAGTVPHPMPTRRRNHPVEDELDDFMVEEDHPVATTLNTDVFTELLRMTEVPGNRQGHEIPPAPNTNQLVGRGRGRIVRPDNPQGGEILGHVGGGTPLRFTVSSPTIIGRPVVEDRSVDPPTPMEDSPANGDIVIDTLGGVDTSANENEAHITASQQNQPNSMGDYIREWTDMRHLYTWNEVPYTRVVNWGDMGISSRGTDSANGEETSDDGNQ